MTDSKIKQPFFLRCILMWQQVCERNLSCCLLVLFKCTDVYLFQFCLFFFYLCRFIFQWYLFCFNVESTHLFPVDIFFRLEAAVAAHPMTDSYLKLREQWNGIEDSHSLRRKQFIFTQVEGQFKHDRKTKIIFFFIYLAVSNRVFKVKAISYGLYSFVDCMLILI